MGQADPAGSAVIDSGPPVMYFDFSDLIAYFQNSRHPTGIQRVQIELFKASLAWVGPVSIRSCAWRQDLGAWAAVDPSEFDRLCTLAARPGHADALEWRDAVAFFTAGLSTMPALTFPPNAFLVNLGTSWWIDGYMAAIRAAKSRRSLRYIPLVFDMIPLLAADYVGPGMTATFAAWIGSVFLHADAVAAISECTGRDVAAQAGLVRHLAHPPIVMPLDAEFTSPDKAPSDAAEDLLLNGLDLTRDEFVVFVGTLEGRKNHLLVFQAWSRLILLHGADAVPLLVCVGKQGWKFEAAQNFLDSRPELESKILLLSGISDEELHSLYDCCRFTVYASHYEGWGLPVTESLCHGKICLTADHSSLPEAGGRFAVYYEDGSLKSFMRQAWALIADAEMRREREALIAAEYRPRSWASLLDGLISDILIRLPVDGASVRPNGPMVAGALYRPLQRSHLLQIDRDAAVAETMRFAAEWHERETWGAWTRGTQARLSFTTPLSLHAQEDLLLYVQVQAAARPVTLSARVGGAWLPSVTIPINVMSYVQFRIPFAAVPPPDTTGIVHLRGSPLTALQELNESDDRIVCFGLASVSFVGADDHAMRVTMVERALAMTET